MGFLQGKRVLIVGVANHRSIASGIALAMAREGAEIAFTYQTEKLKSRVEKLITECDSDPALLFPCDVASDEQIDEIFNELSSNQLDSSNKTITLEWYKYILSDKKLLDKLSIDGKLL